MMEEKKRFKLELDVATGIDSFPMRTLIFGYNTLKMLRQASARKGDRTICRIIIGIRLQNCIKIMMHNISLI